MAVTVLRPWMPERTTSRPGAWAPSGRLAGVRMRQLPVWNDAIILSNSGASAFIVLSGPTILKK